MSTTADADGAAGADFDHHSPAFLADRIGGWARQRETPVAWSSRYGGFWVVSGFDEVNRVSRDERVFTSELGERSGVRCMGIAGVPRPRGIPPAGIAEAPAALHQELRRVINADLLPAAVARLRPFAEALTTWFIDERIEDGRMDLVGDLANPVPAIVTLRLIGLSPGQWRHYADLFHATIAHRPGSAEHERAIAAVPEMMASLFEEVRDRRAHPRDDLLSRLVEIPGPDGRPLDDETIRGVLWNLVGGGLDTTTSLTALSLHHLGVHPELRRRLIEDRGLMPTATEEFLRYFSVNETLTRTVTEDTDLGGRRLHAGDVVLISWLSADHDPACFSNPDEVLLDRSPNRHLAFGVGPHRCIGMHMARSLFEVMVEAVLDRLPDYRIDPGATRFYESNPMLAGVATMPVSFTPGPRAGPDSPPF